ncbi:MAG: Mur ligase family protein, partial [Deinococcota bacterium]
MIQQLAASLASAPVLANVDAVAANLASFNVVAENSSDNSLPAASGIAFHTNQVRPGDAFFALPGEHVHGIRFADKALELGAAFIVSDQPHPKGVQVGDPATVLLALGYVARAQRQGTVIGVTGSAGKTTTKTLAAAALACDKSQGNFNTPLALAKTLVDNLLRGDGNAPIVLELGIDHIGEMDGLVALAKPDIGILTLIAESHLKGLGSLENVATEKKKLINASPLKLVSAEAWHFLTPAEQEGAWCYGLATQDADKALPDNTVLADVHVSQKDASQVLTVLDETITLSTLGTAAARSATAAMTLAKMLDHDLAQAATNISAAKFEGYRGRRWFARGDPGCLRPGA